MTVRVVQPGMLTTVQDRGRWGWQSLGVGPGGAMDLDAMHLANVLVGNDESAAVLESTLVGPVLRFEEGSVVAFTGAPSDALIDRAPVPYGRAVFVAAGTEVAAGVCLSGCRTTIAIAGGIDVAEVLGSRSSNLRAHFGGLEGRALRAGDRLPTGPPTREGLGVLARLRASGRNWAADEHELALGTTPGVDAHAAVRVIAGPEFQRLDQRSRDTLFTQAFTVSPRSDRMGYRLEGRSLSLVDQREMTSEGTAWGTIQMPPDGQLIVLGADRPTTGGYPVIGHVAGVDRSVIAQRKPGDAIRFEPITLADAQRAWLAQQRNLIVTAHALRLQRAGESHDPD